MSLENKMWDEAKRQYLHQVEKVLVSVKSSRKKEVLDDVRSHLDRRFGELRPEQQSWENIQKIITDMGPPTDYAELMDTEKKPEKERLPLSFVGAAIIIFAILAGLMIIFPLIYHPEEEEYTLRESSVNVLPHSFTNDPEILGEWESVDFVEFVNDFQPERRRWDGELFLKRIIFMAEGRCSKPWTWTKGWIYDNEDNIRAEYKIREIAGHTYLFFPWLSGDVTIRGMKPCYYVLRRVSGVRVEKQEMKNSNTQEVSADINAKVSQLLEVAHANLDDVTRIFGKPIKYLWGQQTFTKDTLPSTYIAKYPNQFQVVMSNGNIHEIRFEGPESGYVLQEKLRVGSSLEEVLSVVGQPTETIEGKANKWKDGVLYKDIDGNKGRCYYQRLDQNVRFFFLNYKITAIYITSGSYGKGGSSFQSIRSINSVKEFDDVRWKDLSKLNLSGKQNLIPTLTFNQKTVWPESISMPPGDSPEKVLEKAMNPGLGIRGLHRKGYTGKGVNVAIIDQPMYEDHPEFSGKIVWYSDVGCGSESSMHGPAITSLLVGTNCGIAPDAKVYYVAAPSWTRDTAYQAKALDWIVERSEKLPPSGKIRVVSVSAAPSGPGSPFNKNNEMWDKACERAEASGILVLDCTQHRGFISACWYDANDPENITKCKPGYPGLTGRIRPGNLLVPASPRTTAEEYNKGEYSYQYCGRGGLSWSIPYCAGVLALGWQVNPELSSEQMRELLFKSAYIKDDGSRIINPQEFIRAVNERTVVKQKSPEALIAVVLGKKVLAKDIEPDAVILAKNRGKMSEVEFNKWLRYYHTSRLSTLIFLPLLEQYAKDNDIDPTFEEIKLFSSRMQIISTEMAKEDEQRVKQLEEKLKSPDLNESEKWEIEHELITIRKILKEQENLITMPKVQSGQNDIAKRMVRTWKINKSLFDKYGGRVIFQQAGPEPLDAYRKFLEEHKAQGSFQITEEECEKMFWDYFTNQNMHSFYPEQEGKKIMQQPWWLLDKPPDF
jgi:subtilisin family serine protease